MKTVRISVNPSGKLMHAPCTSGADIRLPEAIAQLRAAASGTR